VTGVKQGRAGGQENLVHQDGSPPAPRPGSAVRRIVARFAEVACPPEVRAGNLTGELLAEFESLRRGAAFLDYSRGGNRAYDIARILRDYLVRVEPGSDDLLPGKAFFVVAGTRWPTVISSSSATGCSLTLQPLPSGNRLPQRWLCPP
jgi:hypothetical protein